MQTQAKRLKTAKLLKTDGRPTPKFDKIRLDNKNYKSLLLDALNFCSYVLEDAEKAQYARDYIKENLNMSASKVPDYEFIHLGSLCWLIDNGVQIKDLAEHDNRLIKIVEKYNNELKIVKTDSVSSRTGLVIGEIEGVIDDVVTRKKNITQPFDILQSMGGTFNVDEVYRRFRTQLIDIRKGGEGYDDMCQKELSMICSALEIILNDCNKFKIIKNKSRVALSQPKKKKRKKK